MLNKNELVSRDRSTKAVLDAILTKLSPAASWMHRPDPEAVREHDFANLLQDFRYAVEQQDRTMMDYCESELRSMYREGTMKKATVAAQSKFMPGSCDGFAPRDTTPKQQREITAVAYDLWLARAFRNGSLQDDWLKAQRQVQKSER